jgi:hypothetical protein
MPQVLKDKPNMTLTMVYHTYTYYFAYYSPSSNALQLTQLIQHHVSRTGSAPVYWLASKTYNITTFIPHFSLVRTTRFRKFAGSPQESK